MNFGLKESHIQLFPGKVTLPTVSYFLRSHWGSLRARGTNLDEPKKKGGLQTV